MYTSSYTKAHSPTTCKECGIDMKIQASDSKTIIWKCINNHVFIEHKSQNEGPYPHDLERK